MIWEDLNHKLTSAYCQPALRFMFRARPKRRTRRNDAANDADLGATLKHLGLDLNDVVRSSFIGPMTAVADAERDCFVLQQGRPTARLRRMDDQAFGEIGSLREQAGRPCRRLSRISHAPGMTASPVFSRVAAWPAPQFTPRDYGDVRPIVRPKYAKSSPTWESCSTNQAATSGIWLRRPTFQQMRPARNWGDPAGILTGVQPRRPRRRNRPRRPCNPLDMIAVPRWK